MIGLRSKPVEMFLNDWHRLSQACGGAWKIGTHVVQAHSLGVAAKDIGPPSAWVAAPTDTSKLF